MRTLIGAAEPLPEPSRISFTVTTASTSGLVVDEVHVWWSPPTGLREPYRTTAYVGEPVPEIEQGGIE